MRTSPTDTPHQESPDIERLLRSVPLLAALPGETIRHLAGGARLLEIPKDGIACHQGGPGDSLFVVEHGDIEIFVPEGLASATRLAILGPGEFFGELSMLDGEARSASARALSQSRLVALSRDQLLKVLEAPSAMRSLLETLTKRLRATDRMVTDRALDNMRLQEEARTDALTGLANRRKLQEDVDELRARVLRYGHRYVVTICDLDHFKGYNDTFGHLMGDHALRTVARTIAQQCRAGDAAYRYGGEEFVVIMPEQTPRSAAIGVERIRQAVQGLAIEHPANPPAGVMTISGGMSTLSVGTGSIDDALAKADEALYQAKSEGRNRLILADERSSPILQ